MRALIARARARLRLGAAPALALVLVSSCGGGGAVGTASTTPLRGGTVRVVVPRHEAGTTLPDRVTLDPELAAGNEMFELYRCCLGRTLLSYTGAPTAQGGADLHPDLATGLPEVSSDGLTWTFHLKLGVHYGPPLQNTDIEAADIARAVARIARVSNPSPPAQYSVIAGFDDYAAGRTASVSGLETPDPLTFVVRLTQPTGDLGYRFSNALTAPIPALRRDPGAPLGVATGHDDGDGGFGVSSGPYMLEGAGAVNFDLAPKAQTAASGLVPGRSITLVRNPSWQAAADPLREALADRIVLAYVPTTADAAAAVDADRADLVLDGGPPPQAPLAQVRAYQSHPSRGRVDIQLRDVIRYVTMNLAVPPFDDLHVRRAVAYAIDRTGIPDLFGGSASGAVTGHLALDSMEGDALQNRDPYRSSDRQTRLRLARQEMAASRYDSTHSGRCDAAVCRHLLALVLANRTHPAALGDLVRDGLAQIGIDVDLRNEAPTDAFTTLFDPTKRTPLAVGWGWGKDYPSGSDYFTALFSHDGVAGRTDFSYLGATPQELHSWGYAVTAVPSVDDRIRECVSLVSGAQARCWAGVDEYLVDKIVPSVPILADNYIEVIPARVTAYSYDQAFDLPALDRVVVAP